MSSDQATQPSNFTSAHFGLSATTPDDDNVSLKSLSGSEFEGDDEEPLGVSSKLHDPISDNVSMNSETEEDLLDLDMDVTDDEDDEDGDVQPGLVEPERKIGPKGSSANPAHISTPYGMQGGTDFEFDAAQSSQSASAMPPHLREKMKKTKPAVIPEDIKDTSELFVLRINPSQRTNRSIAAGSVSIPSLLRFLEVNGHAFEMSDGVSVTHVTWDENRACPEEQFADGEAKRFGNRIQQHDALWTDIKSSVIHCNGVSWSNPYENRIKFGQKKEETKAAAVRRASEFLSPNDSGRLSP
jgi:hypothetical protein